MLGTESNSLGIASVSLAWTPQKFVTTHGRFIGYHSKSCESTVNPAIDHSRGGSLGLLELCSLVGEFFLFSIPSLAILVLYDLGLD